MEILYYKQDDDYIIEMSQDDMAIKFNFTNEELKISGVEQLNDEQINNIKSIIKTHKEIAQTAPYRKEDIYKQIRTLNGQPAWIKNQDIQDWMIKRKEEEEDVK